MSVLVARSGPRTSEVSPYQFTTEQFQQLAELGFFTGQRVQLIRGEILTMPPMKEPHASGISLVLHELQKAFRDGFYVRVQMPLDPGLDSDPEPDVAVVSGGPRTYTQTPTQAHLLVEVADTSFEHDTTTKLKLYAEAQYPEYWVLDLAGQQLLVFRDPVLVPVEGHTYRTRLKLGPADTVSPLAMPTATIRVADLLP